jgi:hypothetical protein
LPRLALTPERSACIEVADARLHGAEAPRQERSGTVGGLERRTDEEVAATRLREAPLGSVHASARLRKRRTRHAERFSPVVENGTKAALRVYPSCEGVHRFRGSRHP